MDKPSRGQWRAQHIRGRLYRIIDEDSTTIGLFEGFEEDAHMAALAPTLLEMVEDLLAELERIVKPKRKTKGKL